MRGKSRSSRIRFVRSSCLLWSTPRPYQPASSIKTPVTRFLSPRQWYCVCSASWMARIMHPMLSTRSAASSDSHISVSALTSGKVSSCTTSGIALDYLRRARLLSQEGNPINLFGIASHLYHTEPGNLAIAVLLQNGVIHDICSQASSVEAERDLVTLLCHLFGRRYLPEVYATTRSIHDLVQKGPSRVVLAPLHPKARAVLFAHQKETLSIFSAYASAFSSQHTEELGPENRLPLSGGVTASDLPIRPLARGRPSSLTSPRESRAAAQGSLALRRHDGSSRRPIRRRR